MLNLRRPTPYIKRGDQAIMQPPTHYVTLLYGTLQYHPDGSVMCRERGGPIYKTERLYVSDGSVWEAEDKRVPLDQVEGKYPWFWEEYRKVESTLRREVRVALPEERVNSADELTDNFLSTWESLPEHIRAELAEKYTKTGEVPVEKEKMWECDACGVETPLRLKGVHMATQHKKPKE